MVDDAAFKTELTARWDAGAAAYDDTPRHGILHEDEWVAWRRLVAAMLGDPAHAGVPRLRVLDVGTGTGVLAMLAAGLGHEVVGLDLSEGMLAQARRKAIGAGLDVSFRKGDAEALPDDLGSFDAVVSRQLLWTLPDPVRALVGWRAVVRPGGLIALVDMVHRPRAWPLGTATRIIRSWQRRRTHEAPHAAGHAYPDAAYDRLPLGRQVDTAAVERCLRAAGLERVRIRSLAEVDRVERRHLGRLDRLADDWRRYLATARVPAAEGRDDHTRPSR